MFAIRLGGWLGLRVVRLLLVGFAGCERGSRHSQIVPNAICDRVRTSKHTPRDPFRLLERRYGLAEIVERGVVVLVERPRPRPPASA